MKIINFKGMKVISVCLAASMLTGCGSTVPVDHIEDYVAPVSELTLPENAKIIGLGEATHGNVEFQKLKLEVFQTIVEKENCHLFAIEGDFGGCVKVDEYINGGDGTAEDIVSEIGFGIYRTKEMADMIDWMRTYNTGVPENEKIHFYGFDMQRYDNNKEILNTYLTQVDPEFAQTVDSQMKDMTDDTAYTQKKEINEKAASDMEQFLGAMEEKKDTYIAVSNEHDYEIAYECGESIMQNATVQAGNVNYNKARDKYMADKVNFIYNLEGQQRLFITAHNGHITRKALNPMYEPMGQMLAEQYKDGYFSIGTDFIEGEVTAVNSKGNLAKNHLKNENALTAQIKSLDGNEFYMDFPKAKENTALKEIIDSNQRMTTVDANFSSWQKLIKSAHTLKGIPDKAYDGMVLYKEVTASGRL